MACEAHRPAWKHLTVLNSGWVFAWLKDNRMSAMRALWGILEGRVLMIVAQVWILGNTAAGSLPECAL